MMKLRQTLPSIAAKSDGAVGRSGLSIQNSPTGCTIRKRCDRLTWKLTKPEAPPQQRTNWSNECGQSGRTQQPDLPSPESAPRPPGKGSLYFYLRPKIMSIPLRRTMKSSRDWPSSATGCGRILANRRARRRRVYSCKSRTEREPRREIALTGRGASPQQSGLTGGCLVL
jgi:hypothetical protein